MNWIDTHCHLDAPEFGSQGEAIAEAARTVGVSGLVLPAVRLRDWDTVRHLAHAVGAAYAVGIHPLAVEEPEHADEGHCWEQLRAWIGRWRSDPRLVAVGEIGLDHFVPDRDRARQQRFYAAQLRLAREWELPVLLHVRRSADALLAGLRRCAVPGGIAHAFNGSRQQAQQFVDRGFALGFGGTLTFDRSLQIRRLASDIPAEALVLETDAPDIPPQWLYRPAATRGQTPPVPNTPSELPRIGAVLARLRGWSLGETARVTRTNALRVLPRLVPLFPEAQ